jgi:PAS domain S-box-containing protein
LGAENTLRKFGADQVEAVPWGTHFCQFYQTTQDLIDVLTPYFAAGFRGNEYCIWTTPTAQQGTNTKTFLKQAIPRFNHYLKQEKLSIIDPADFFVAGKFDPNTILEKLLQQEKTAIANGFNGLRFASTTFFISQDFWATLIDFETALNHALSSHKIIGLCSYSLTTCSAPNVVEVERNHTGTLLKTANGWGLMEDAFQRLQTEQHYQSIIQTSLDAFWVTDLGGRFLEVNGAFCNLTGYSRAELLNMCFQGLELDPPHKIACGMADLALRGHGRLETRFRRKDGIPIDLEASLHYLKSGAGDRVFVFAHNITKRRRNEEAIKQSEIRYKELANCITDSFVALDSNLRYVYWNKASEKLTGIKAKDALGHHVNEIFSNNQNQKMADTYLNVLKTRKPKVFIDEFIMNQKKVIVENHIYPTKNGVAVFTKDITQRKALQDKLLEYTQKLEDLVKVRTEKLKNAERLAAIGETAGMVGHDIRNPLQTISGELYLTKTEVAALPDSDSKQNLMESMKVISEQLAYINKIVADLQDFARTSLPNFEDIALERTVNEIMETVSVPGDIRVSVAVMANFPKFKSDLTYLKRILINLITNAVQAMPNGGVLSITATFDCKVATLCVRDTGHGIPLDAQNKIFKPLFTTKSKGQGLGLAVVKKLTDALGGHIRFESAVGKGTCFIVELPLSGT